MTSGLTELRSLIQQLAAAPAQVQSLMDQQWNNDIERWSDLVYSFIQAAPPEQRPLVAALLAPTAPTRQIVATYELDARVRVQTRHGTKWGIYAHPLNVTWENTYRSMSKSASQIHLTVEMVTTTAQGKALRGVAAANDLSPLQQNEQPIPKPK